FKCDWSSDVCSSDLETGIHTHCPPPQTHTLRGTHRHTHTRTHTQTHTHTNTPLSTKDTVAPTHCCMLTHAYLSNHTRIHAQTHTHTQAHGGEDLGTVSVNPLCC